MPHRTPAVLLACLAIGSLPGVLELYSQEVSDLKSDERLVFFTTHASLSADQTHWDVPIHLWTFELDNASFRRTSVATTLRLKYGLTRSADTRVNFDDRVRLLVADNERGKQMVIKIAGQQITLPPTMSNGHAITHIKLDAKRVAEYTRDGELLFSAVLRPADKRLIGGKVLLASPTGRSVISDVDDTVKITGVTDRKKLLEYSLYRRFEAVPGMAKTYARWADQGLTFHFVSSSPWHFYQPLDAFMDEHRFPPRSLSLKHFRFRDATLLNLFKSGLKTKPEQIQQILVAFPQRRFVLIGDSGEQDPEVYAAIARQLPDRIERIFIRNVTGAKPSDQRFTGVFSGIAADKWLLFDDPSQLQLPQ